jgi:hypothetical protein
VGLAFPGTAALFLSSCVITNLLSIQPHREPFIEAEYARYAAPGSATVRGQLAAFIEGEFRPGDRSDMELLPVTAYTTEMVQRVLVNGEVLSRATPALKKYRRVVETDAQGFFVFTGVPAGDYYLFGCVKWNAQPLYPEYDTYQWALERVHISAGQNLSLRVMENPGKGGLAGGTL